MKKLVVSLLSITICVLMLSSCGSGDKKSAKSENSGITSGVSETESTEKGSVSSSAAESKAGNNPNTATYGYKPSQTDDKTQKNDSSSAVGSSASSSAESTSQGGGEQSNKSSAGSESGNENGESAKIDERLNGDWI